MFANQQNGLPVSPDQPQYPQLALSYNTPPYVPARQFNPAFQPLVPFISAATAIEIQNKAQSNQLRMFMFNMAAPNSFQNAYFDELLGYVVKVAEYMLANRQVADTQQAIQAAVPATVNMLAAVNTRDFPALAAYVQPQQRQEIYALIMQFDQIGEWAKMQAQPQQMQTQWSTGQATWGQAAPVQQPGTGWLAGPSTTPVNTNRDYFGNGGGQAMPLGSTGSFGSRFTSHEPVADVVVNTAPAAASAPAPKHRVPATPDNWTSSPMYPYFIGYDPVTTVAELEIMPDGSTVPLFNDRAEMDYNKHATPNVFGRVPERLDLGKAGETIQNLRAGIIAINETAGHVPEPDLSDETVEHKLTSRIDSLWSIQGTETEAWIDATLRRASATLAGVPHDVYRVYTVIAKPVVTKADESEAVAELRKSLTYISLAENLKAAYDMLSPELYTTINLKLTAMVNRSLCQELGLPRTKLGMTNFADDIVPLLEVMESKYGTSVKSAFLYDQSNKIHSALGLLDPTAAAQQSEYYLSATTLPPESRPAITYVASTYSLTLVNCLAWELRVELAEEGMPTLIEAHQVPLFYDLVKGIFDDANSYKEKVGNREYDTVSRHLIRTADGRVLEATRGVLVKDSYLLTVIE